MERRVTALSDRRPFTLAYGLSAQAQFGQKAMLNLVEPSPGAIVPERVYTDTGGPPRARSRAMRSATDTRGQLHHQAEGHDRGAG